MPIDEPVSALQALNLSDERQRSPLLRFAKPFLAIAKLIPGAGLTIAGVQAAVEWLAGRAQSNMKEFEDVFAEELRYRGAQVQKLISENEAQKTFVADELGGLALDALRRAEQCRARERVGRLARIVVRAAEVGSQDGPDAIEEMMAIATELSDIEVLVLQLAADQFRKERAANPLEAERSVVARAWKAVPGGVSIRMSEDELLSVGARLESVGFALRTNRQEWETPVYRPLGRGYKFIEYIRSVK